MSVASGIEERVVAAMKELGFTATDAKAYIALVKGNPATGYELAARSGVPRSAVYNVLKRLEAMGLVNVVQDKPAKYLPLPPERLLALVKTKFSRNIDELRTALDGLSEGSHEAATWSLQGYSSLMDQAAELVTGASQTVHLSAWAREAKRLERPLRQAAEKGAEIVIFSFTPLEGLPGRTFSYGIAEADLERYWGHKIIVVTDHARALVGSAEESEDARAVVTEESVLVEMAISNLVLDVTLFGQRTGVETEDVIRGLTAHLAPVEDLLPDRPC